MKCLRAEVDRICAWLDRLHEKYGEHPPIELLDIAYQKLASAVQALNELE